MTPNYVHFHHKNEHSWAGFLRLLMANICQTLLRHPTADLRAKGDIEEAWKIKMIIKIEKNQGCAYCVVSIPDV